MKKKNHLNAFNKADWQIGRIGSPSMNSFKMIQ